MNRLASVRLRVADTDALETFYTAHLGMTARRVDDCTYLGYPGCDADLELYRVESAKPYRHDRLDEYWKIGITLPNVDLAFEQLSAAKIAITRPGQFRDIGYLCHLTDPLGFQIELLQHTFAGQRRTADGNPSVPLGGGARIGQITLRTSDIKASRHHYESTLGMRLLSVQECTDLHFTLYFLAFTDDVPPHADLGSIGNRPWLYQRRYTTLELQHLADKRTVIRQCRRGDCGFAGLRLERL